MEFEQLTMREAATLEVCIQHEIERLTFLLQACEEHNDKPTTINLVRGQLQRARSLYARLRDREICVEKTENAA